MAGMLKFTCEQCGHRIATPPRRLGQLVTCPECGHATHPLAGEILSKQLPRSTPSLPQVNPRSAAGGERACANCGASIGRLQKLHLWENDVVCTSCHRALDEESSRASIGPAEARPARATIQRVASKRRPTQAIAEGVHSVSTTNQTALASRAEVIDVHSARPDARLDALPFAAAWRAVPLTPRGRATLLLAAFCFLAAAVYGALTLLRDLAGIIAAIAFALLGVACVYLVVRASVAASRQFLAARAEKRAGSEAVPAVLGDSAGDR